MASRTYVYVRLPSHTLTGEDYRRSAEARSRSLASIGSADVHSRVTPTSHEQHYAGNELREWNGFCTSSTYVHDDATESSDSDPAVPRIDFIRFNAMYTYRMEYGYVA